MSLTGLFDLLERRTAYKRLLEALRQSTGTHQVGLLAGAKPLLLAALWQHLQAPVLVITPHPEDARRLHDQLLSYIGDDGPAFLLPELDVLSFERLVADDATNNQRLQALWTLATTTKDAPLPLVVSSVAAALRKTLSPQAIRESSLTIRMRDRVSLGTMLAHWIRLGYRREEGVEVPGTFALRGGIVDVFPPNSPLPVRIELWSDRVESLRLFDSQTQRSVREVDNVTIIPSREVLPPLSDRERTSHLIAQLNLTDCLPSVRERIQEELASLFSDRYVEETSFYNGILNDHWLLDFLHQEGLLVLDRYSELESEAKLQEERLSELRATREGRGELPTNFPSPQVSWHRLLEAVETRGGLALRSWPSQEDDLGFRPPPSYYGCLEQFTSDAKSTIRQGRSLVLATLHASRLSELLSQEEVGANLLSDVTSPPRASISLVATSLREGWTLPVEDGEVTLLTDAELFGTAKERRRRPRATVRRESFLSELVPGSHVVHVDHGIAHFAGTTQMGSDDEQKEYLVLEYAEGDRLYVPSDHLDRVSPYMAPNDQSPTPTRLGTQEWSRAKERVKRSAQELAGELLELYASRQVAQGHSFSPDSPWQRQLEDSFPFQETMDQAETIDEVKRNMEELRPMDRLVCGDVGYGKTEVALRAAFKTVMDGMQVAVLVPTTVLAQQHYATFSERLSTFPVKVEVLSRFRTNKEQKEVIEELKVGTVDMVVGTHRLLQKDVSFKNLGLVVVDEEQRFGVAHKERLKQMRTAVDMLTLSATPIPRTFYMALSGIRDMSTMETPPEERFPVVTFVSEYSDDLIREAILRELERGGQVFFLHNRVKSISRVADHLRQLVPQAQVAVGHGRMLEADLERVMAEFTQGEVNVLVCTTIIESGLDIPNANTLIIDRADRFGLAQLYQLRGRVGRASHRAYSYLLIPRGRRITEAAEKRLKAILEAAELGAGFRLAMRDLEIRGAGNVLGPEQSGHIHAVGFELYNQLLSEAVEELKAGQEGAPPPSRKPPVEVRVDLPIPAYIPQEYIPHLPTRLAIYQRLTRVHERDEVKEMGKELRDRFGPLPQSMEDLLYLVDLKALAATSAVESLSRRDSSIVLTLLEPTGGAAPALEKALGPEVRVGNQQIRIDVHSMGSDWKEKLLDILESLAAFRERVQAALTP